MKHKAARGNHPLEKQKREAKQPSCNSRPVGLRKRVEYVCALDRHEFCIICKLRPSLVLLPRVLLGPKVLLGRTASVW